ncbi:MAG: conserved protein of unknown function [Nitrospira sp.]
MEKHKAARSYIGLSGYSYRPWQGVDRFYPPGLKQTEFLRYYATRYQTVELDGTWYRIPTESMVQSWMSSTPFDFLFAPKVHRQITHQQRLKAESFSLVNLLLDRLKPLAQQGRLGPLLIQLPPNFTRDEERLGRFLEQLPTTTRWAVEFRHESWDHPSVEALLTHFNISWVAADTDDKPAQRRHTADFWYVRLRRTTYDREALQQWSSRFAETVAQGMDCFVYCKHEDEGAPWLWADTLLSRLGADQTVTARPRV